MVFTFLENVSNLGIFTRVPPLHSRLSPNVYQKFEDDLERQVFYILCDLHFFFSSIMAYLDEGWLFIGWNKIGSILGYINKEVLAQFLYKPA